MFAQVELITMDYHVCHTVDAKMVRFGAKLWYNAFAQTILSGMEPIVLPVLVVCSTMLQDATVSWEHSLTEPLAVKLK